MTAAQPKGRRRFFCAYRYTAKMSLAPLSLIVAHDETGLIGRDGDLPWRLPNDLKHFKALTLGHTVLMGRKTWQSLPRKPLPERENRVLTRDAAFVAPGATVFTDLAAALAAPAQGQLFVIGGAELYRLCLPLAATLHITRVHTSTEGDTYFPHYASANYRETACVIHPADEKHAHAYSFLTLERLDAGQP